MTTTNETQVCAPDVNQMLAERGNRYGSFEGHARISQELKAVMTGSEGWDRLAADQKEALEMVQHKVARILNGNPNWHDSWLDVVGYATLVTSRLEKEHNAASKLIHCDNHLDVNLPEN
jgi:hypothetical protein